VTQQDSTFGSLGFAFKTMTIEEVVDKFAYGTDQFGVSVKIPIGLQRAKGGVPEAGETWVLSKDMGLWCFAAVLNNPGPGGSVPTLSLSYNGNGPVPCQVFDGLSWDPSTGGFLYIVLPGALSGFDVDVPVAAAVNGSGVIQGFAITLFNEVSAIVLAFGPTGSPANVDIIGLRQPQTEGSPGDTVSGGVPSTQGMIVPDYDGSVWVCTTSYDPVGPVDAVWVQITPGWGDTGGGVPSSPGLYLGQLATDASTGILYMWNGTAWLASAAFT